MVLGELPEEIRDKTGEVVKQLEKDLDNDGMQIVAESRYNTLAHIHKSC